MTNELIGKKVLITTTDWFVAPDGLQYRALFGTLKSVTESTKALGFAINRSHANYFFEVGKMKIMGCRVMYMIECEGVNSNDTEEILAKEGGIIKYNRPTMIYITE